MKSCTRLHKLNVLENASFQSFLRKVSQNIVHVVFLKQPIEDQSFFFLYYRCILKCVKVLKMVKIDKCNEFFNVHVYAKHKINFTYP